VGVGEALCLDVPGSVEEPLDEALAAPERGGGLADRRLELLVDLRKGARDLQAASAAAEGRLDRDRKAVLGRERMDLRGALHRLGCPGDERCTRAMGDVPCAHLVAERLDRCGRRSDPHETGLDDGPREVCVLGEKAVARVDGVGPRPPRDVEQLADVEVRLLRPGARERERLVGDAHVQRLAIGVCVDRDGADPGVTARAGDADCDLAAVRDEDLGDGGHGSP
jgi:hypothetical protein